MKVRLAVFVARTPRGDLDCARTAVATDCKPGVSANLGFAWLPQILMQHQTGFKGRLEGVMVLSEDAFAGLSDYNGERKRLKDGGGLNRVVLSAAYASTYCVVLW